MPIEFLAYSAIVLRSQRTGSLRPAVQFTQAETNYQPVVIPAKAGIQASFNGILDSRLRGNDGSPPFEKVNLDKTAPEYQFNSWDTFFQMLNL